MSDTAYVQLLDLACGALLLSAVLIVWRRELAVIIRVFAVQGLALTALVTVLAVHERSAELGVVAAGIAVLRVGVLPYLLRRALARPVTRGGIRGRWSTWPRPCWPPLL